jgi:hypothetical protein
VNIRLHGLCITASSLRSVIDPASFDDKDPYTRMYNASIQTIRRIVDAPSDDNYMFREGRNKEDEIVNDHFQSVNFEKQKVCGKIVNIGGIDIPFRALLDVYDSDTKSIVEIKCAVRKEPDLSNINYWINEVYCKAYNVQAQVQMLCCSDFHKMVFLVYTKSNNQLYYSKIWEQDKLFVQKHEKVILQYWKMLCDVNKRYLDGDTQVKLKVHEYDNNYKLILGAEMEVDIEKYIRLDKEVRDRKGELELIKRDIIRKLESRNLQDVRLNGFSAKKYPKSKVYKYSDIVRDKGILESLSEEELELYTHELDEKYVIRVQHKKDFFGEV